MDAHQHLGVLLDRSHHHGHVLFAGDVVHVRVHAKLAVRRRQARRSHAVHVPLVLHAVLDDVGDGDDLQAVLDRELAQVGQPGHGAVLVHDFANHRRRRHPRDQGQIDRRLGLPGPFQHAAFFRAQRKTWPGRSRSDGRVFASMATRTVSARSCAEIPVVTRPRASIDTVNAVP